MQIPLRLGIPATPRPTGHAFFKSLRGTVIAGYLNRQRFMTLADLDEKLEARARHRNEEWPDREIANRVL